MKASNLAIKVFSSPMTVDSDNKLLWTLAKATTLYQVEKTDNCILWRHKISNMAWRVFILSHGASGFRQLSEVHNSASTWAIAITQRLVYQKLDWEFPLDVNAMFHRLCKLNITSCPELAGKLPSYLPSLDKLQARPGGTFKHFKLTCLTEGFMQGLTEVRNLEIHVCKDLLSLGSLSFVRYLEITNGLPLISLGEEVEAKETAQLDIPFTVECLTFHLSLQKFQKAFSSLYNLRELYFTRYHGRVLMRESNLPSSLKILEIKDCFELQCALDEEENVNDNIRNTGLLEELTIKSCLLLTCLFARGELPSIPHHFTLHNTGNSDIPVKVVSGLLFPFLKKVSLFANLRLLFIGCFEKLEALPNCFHKLESLQRLFIAGYPNIISFPEEGLPPNLTSLKLRGTNICKPVFKWGVHKLSSLEELTVCRCQDVESFPQEEIGMKLPSSLTQLMIENFPNLRYVSPGASDTSTLWPA
ncbi:hypothetical protein GOBAR_AA27096 [Gossypium barbadense]|uniref:Uncharacterized protein n=1 Tax=Gossypium barbadense TaxID=3634 RepID=A0A2P5WR93_GOSBA|nr:hypothetical protein GOBAR_AA27096 [Gossypium barbadense]